jgi:cytochrome c oxidase cbb3-type subunit 4
MDGAMMNSVMTVISFLVFVGIIYWAYSGKNKARFEQLARLPIDNDE